MVVGGRRKACKLSVSGARLVFQFGADVLVQHGRPLGLTARIKRPRTRRGTHVNNHNLCMLCEIYVLGNIWAVYYDEDTTRGKRSFISPNLEGRAITFSVRGLLA